MLPPTALSGRSLLALAYVLEGAYVLEPLLVADCCSETVEGVTEMEEKAEACDSWDWDICDMWEEWERAWDGASDTCDAMVEAHEVELPAVTAEPTVWSSPSHSSSCPCAP
jgi:hypothetical protein